MDFKYIRFCHNQGDANSIKSKFLTIFYPTIIYFKNYQIRGMCAGHDVKVEGSSPSWADIERSIS